MHAARAALPSLQKVNVADVLLPRHCGQDWTPLTANKALQLIKSLRLWDGGVSRLRIGSLIEDIDGEAVLANAFGDAIGTLPGLTTLHVSCGCASDNLTYNLVVSRFVRIPGVELFNEMGPGLGERPDCCPSEVYWRHDDSDSEFDYSDED